MKTITIKPENELRDTLLSVQLPGRYVGGEYGIIKKENPDFRMGLCFPDLYEIGMSNLAIRLLYRELNSIDSISCERVFTPAPDFEEALADREIPLYTLESGTPLSSVDLLGFSIGYELSATNVLSVLKSGQIPVLSAERGEEHPVIIAGGPAVTNPLPLGKFLDGVWIGEAEESFVTFIQELSVIKKRGGKRKDILSALYEHPNMWIPGSSKKAERAMWSGFSSFSNFKKGFIVPNISTVQDHGIVEIMRGCPSGCRFCHAGYFYRPYRQKSIEQITAEVESLIKDYGYREITLSSLSSGDYKGIEQLIRTLNEKWNSDFISFAFPSMRVDSVTLPLLGELSRVRKSGLTFAVETPDPGRQAGLNKNVPADRVIEILQEAKAMGWNISKFYFMTGLPFSSENEGVEIAEYLNSIQSSLKIKINANIGTFIPKPHTPFQWSSQLDEEESLRRIQEVRHNVNRGIKVGYHSPFISTLEGVLSRGGEEISDLIHSAFNRGARLDAWDEYIKRDIWREEFEKNSNIVKDIFTEKSTDNKLPWDGIDLGYSRNFLVKELKKAEEQRTTSPCNATGTCSHNCGVCVSGVNPVDAVPGKNENPVEKVSEELENNIQNRSMIDKFRMLFRFSKTGKAVFYSHINIMQIFERSFLRAGFPVRFTEGFNPKPRLEFAHPLALGYSTFCDIGAVDIEVEISGDDFKNRLNKFLPEGISVEQSLFIVDRAGIKRKSLMSIYGGSRYRINSSGKSAGAAVHIEEALQTRDFEDKGITSDKSVNDDNECFIKILQKGKGSTPGLKKVLNSIAGPEDTYEYDLIIERTGLYAKREGKFISYFDYFS